MDKLLALSFLLAVATVAAQVVHLHQVPLANFDCPSNKSTYHPDPVYCNQYIQCKNASAFSRICPDGLVFVNDYSRERKIRCDYPFNVDCSKRSQIRPSIDTEEPSEDPLCLKRNALYQHPDPRVCHQFVYCSNGKSSIFDCTPGLIFDPKRGTCSWPQDAQRSGCVVEEAKAEGEFECPEIDPFEINPKPFHSYPNPNSCSLFYLCLKGQPARESSCDYGQVYNPELEMCDLPEKVPGCENVYPAISVHIAKEKEP